MADCGARGLWAGAGTLMCWALDICATQGLPRLVLTYWCGDFGMRAAGCES